MSLDGNLDCRTFTSFRVVGVHYPGGDITDLVQIIFGVVVFLRDQVSDRAGNPRNFSIDSNCQGNLECSDEQKKQYWNDQGKLYRCYATIVLEASGRHCPANLVAKAFRS